MLTRLGKTRSLAAALALMAIFWALLASAQPVRAVDVPTNDVPLDMENYLPLLYPSGLSVFNLYWDSDWDTNNPGFNRADIDLATSLLTGSNYFDKTAQYGVPKINFSGSAQSQCGGAPDTTTSSVILVAFLLCEESLGPLAGVPWSSAAFPLVPMSGDHIYNVIVPRGKTIDDFGAKSCHSYGAYHFVIQSLPAVPFGVPGPGRPIIYTVIPAECVSDVAGLMGSISHEDIEAATDPSPLPSQWSWIDDSTVTSISALFSPLRAGEAGDLCQSGNVSVTYGPIAMKVASYWSNADNACMVGPSRVVSASFQATGLSGLPVDVTVNGSLQTTPTTVPPPLPPPPYSERLREGATYSFPDVVSGGAGQNFTHLPGACSGTVEFPAGNTDAHAAEAITCAYTLQDTTPPVISAHGDETAEATSAAGASVSYTSPATSDAVDGAGVASCVPASGSTFPLGTTPVTCNATDAAGNAATPTNFNVRVQDTTPPVISAHGDETAEATSAAGASVSYTSPATSDAVDGAGVASCVPASGSTFALGTTPVTCNATDAAGNAATPTNFNVRVQDTTPPVISCGAPDALWHAIDVSIGCTASDGGSGLAVPADASFSLMTSVPASTETATAVTNGHIVCDFAGNCMTAGPIGPNKVDKRPPAVTISVPAAVTYTLNQAVVANYGCTDLGSGVATCSGNVASGINIDTSSVGSHTFTVNATDRVGNASSQSVTYKVTYKICLLYDPTKPFLRNNQLPIKVRICDSNNVNLSSASVVLTAVSVTPSGSIVSTANPRNIFRFDLGLAGYVYNLDTKNSTAGSYTLNFLVTGDPILHSAPFKLK